MFPFASAAIAAVRSKSAFPCPIAHVKIPPLENFARNLSVFPTEVKLKTFVPGSKSLVTQKVPLTNKFS